MALWRVHAASLPLVKRLVQPASFLSIDNADRSFSTGQGGKLVRAAGTCAKILKEPTSRYCLVKMPSGAEKLIDSRCRATIGRVSNPSHNTRTLRKAGQSRWLGRRPVVRGVAMNPVDHPHGGGEGRSKSSGSFGRVSQTPWGKPTKCGRNQQRKRNGKFK
ncbi:hypothetical protein P3X46_000755 [Hevea brasiliensis]|uniref:Large ribosomal subunit protein uL2 C-terminal domain-containing protein n=1 Tax=Hevea brasiliensis TaxID=3981 RepID=A0ABQ9NAF6_HEVBR|nr:hypothetical protein P3X46_000755 [Hevea brasiliensis]